MNSIAQLSDHLHLMSILRVSLTVIIGFLVAKLISTSLSRLMIKRLTIHQTTLISRIIFYAILLLFIASAIQDLGFQITALLGATGILTVAIGIASQTSMSNVVSGFFIIGEKPFEIGNTIKVGEIIGDVMSIDFFSIKLKTPENTMVRIPNEMLIKSLVTNLSYYPIRRIDIMLHIDYPQKVDAVKRALLEIATNNSFCLKDPSPKIAVDALKNGYFQLLFAPWVKRQNVSEAKSQLLEAVQNMLNDLQVQLPNAVQTMQITNQHPFSVQLIESR